MNKKQALEILRQAINYNSDGCCTKGNWMLGTDGVEAVRIAIKVLEEADDMNLKVGTKLVCIVENSSMFAPCEVVEIEYLAESGGSGYCKLKGYTAWLNKDTIEKLFRIY